MGNPNSVVKLGSTLVQSHNKINSSNVSGAKPPKNNVTQSSQEVDFAASNGPEEMAHMLHEKQYTPDLKQSDCRLNSSTRKMMQPLEKSNDPNQDALICLRF